MTDSRFASFGIAHPSEDEVTDCQRRYQISGPIAIEASSADGLGQALFFGVNVGVEKQPQSSRDEEPVAAASTSVRGQA
jgi:hypothetical protein